MEAVTNKNQTLFSPLLMLLLGKTIMSGNVMINSLDSQHMQGKMINGHNFVYETSVYTVS